MQGVSLRRERRFVNDTGRTLQGLYVVALPGSLTPGPFPNREGVTLLDYRGLSFNASIYRRLAPLPDSGRGRGLGISTLSQNV